MLLSSNLEFLLARYQPFDSQDARQVQRIREFLKGGSRCFERTFVPGHITGSAWLMDPSGKKVLLTHHKKLGKWLQLGGHADGNTDILAVALREAREESGIDAIEPVSTEIFDVDVHRIPAHDSEPAHDHHDIRFAMRARHTDTTPSSESNELAWVDLDRLQDLTQEPSMLRMKSKWLRNKW